MYQIQVAESKPAKNVVIPVYLSHRVCKCQRRK
jgi:hypothetical protein